MFQKLSCAIGGGEVVGGGRVIGGGVWATAVGGGGGGIVVSGMDKAWAEAITARPKQMTMLVLILMGRLKYRESVDE